MGEQDVLILHKQAIFHSSQGLLPGETGECFSGCETGWEIVCFLQNTN